MFSNTTNQKISELKIENEGMVQDYDIIVVTITYYISSAKRKIKELK